MIRENSEFRILEDRGGIENFKNLEGEHRKFINHLNRGPVKI
jgi:predicted subunit of tRNA(5-methylaminomethyl-2-thiouridylate) methyltransferase